MAGPRDPDNPTGRAPAQTPARKPVKRAPNRAPATSDPEARVPRTRLIDDNKWPGLRNDELGSANVGTYAAWLRDMPTVDPFSMQLIQAYGPQMQAIAWRWYQDETEPIDRMNYLRVNFPDFESRLSGLGGSGPGGGGRGRGGGGGGGGGGGTAEPTPEQIAAAKAAIKNRAGELGRPISDEELTTTATSVVRDGWNSAQLDDFLLGDPTKVTDPGLVTASVDQIRQFAANQLITVSDATARGWAERINSGEMTTEAVQSIFQQQAIGEFGWAADAIKAGINMRDMLAPARDQIAKELELTPDAVDLMDPKWRGMVTTTDDKGAVRAATLTEVTRSARKAPEWAKTNSSKQLAANTFMLVRQAFEGS